jgi:hypothetical protein
VDTQVKQTVSFKNDQNFEITASTYTQDISQETEVKSTTDTRQGQILFETEERFSYPLTVDYMLTFAADGSVSQLGNVSQEFKSAFWSPFFASFVDNKVNSTDTLELSSSFSITGNSGAQSSQSYSSADTRGHEYSCTVKSANNALTSVSEGCGGDK